MDDNKKLLVAGAVALFGVLVYSSVFVVQQWETAIRLRLGEIVASDIQPGLNFKVPILNQVMRFDARIQTLDSRPERFLTIEKKDVIVDSYVKWRINNAAQFFRSTGGSSERTGQLLSERISTSLRDEFGKRTIQEVVSEDRVELMDSLTKRVDTQSAEFGIEVVDVRVKKIDLPPEVSESVYNRMRAERERVARDLRAKGAEAAERIRADADRQRTVIIADAYREAEETRGLGDARAAAIYADAFNQDPDFYGFYRSLTAYRAAFGHPGSTLVLSPNSDFFRYFGQQGSSSDARLAAPATLRAPEPAANPPAAVLEPDAAVAAPASPAPAGPPPAVDPGSDAEAATSAAAEEPPQADPPADPALGPAINPGGGLSATGD